MRSRRDARIDGGKRKKRPGGKALQRLFNYLAQRGPELAADVVAAVPVPRSARPRFALTARAFGAKTVRRPAARRAVAPPPAAKRIANAISKAAGAQRRAAKRPPGRRSSRPAAAPAGAALGWQFLGPSVIPKGQTYGTNRVDVAGRVSCIAVDPSNPKHVLVGAAGGGIWESRDSGATWAPRTDGMPTLAIGAITFDPRNPRRVYAGSGEGNFYWNLGAGVYRSNDGGTSWSVAAGAPFLGVGFYDLVVDPRRPTVLYAATTHGFYRSTNRGVSWTQKRAGRCWDISVHPNGGTVEILCAFADGLFASTNAGNSFSAVALPSAPGAAWDRLAVDRVASAPDIAYAFGSAGGTARLWRRAGSAWTRINPPALSTAQAWYDWYVAATPDKPGEVYLGAIDAFRGTLVLGQWRWTNITTQGANSIHPDQHCLAFTPGASKVIYAGNDGGIYRSASSGSAWKACNKGLAVTEIEYMASDPNNWQWLMAGTQDNGTIRFIGSAVWDHIADGDGGDCGVNQLDPNVVYHSYYNVSLERSANKGDNWSGLAPPAAASLFYPPVEVSGSTVAIGAASLIVTRSGGQPWSSVSLGLSSGEVPSAMREIDANTLLVGTSAGSLLRVSWTGTAWSRTPLASPASRYISCIAVDPSNPQRFWVTLSEVGGGQVYRSDNSGSSWINCTGGLPPNLPMNAVVVDPANFRRVWVAGDVGVYQTLDLGATWAAFSSGLPNAIAADLLFHRQDRRLICGTRNRGAWAIQVP